MVDYTLWRESQLSVTTLLLDSNNPRIPDTGETLSQRELLADLVKNDKVYELAKSVADNGYFPVEALIYVEENGKKVVLEGNRRLAALKLLLSPDSSPDTATERRFRAVAKRVSIASIQKVKALRAPSRRAAAPIIMSKHTRNQVEDWSPLMQAKFYHNLVDQGLSVDTISAEYNIAPSQITDALLRDTMYSLATALELPPKVAEKVMNPRSFPITNLERLYKNPDVIKFLGITFDANKQLKGIVDPAEFKKGYAKIVTDIAEGTIHSRSLNTTKEMTEYLGRFGHAKPDLTKAGTFTADSITGDSANKKTTPATQKPTTRPKARRASKALIPKDFVCDVRNDRIVAVYGELQHLDVAQYPNAVALLFRSLLEMSLGYYLDRTGYLATMRDDEKKRLLRRKNPQNLPRDWHPTLSEMMKYATRDGVGIIVNGNLLRALKKVVAQKEELLSVDTLNLFAHNQHFHPTEPTLRTFWSELQGLLEITLVEPSTPLATKPRSK